MSPLRFCCLFAAALTLTGCSNSPPRSQTSGDEALADSQVVSSPTAGLDRRPSTRDESVVPPQTDENNIYFKLGKTAVDPEGKDKLRRHADYLKQNPKKKLMLSGHADDSGSRTYSLAIAEERLVAVHKQLRSYGVPPGQIRLNRTVSARKQQACQSTECRQQMRRVELSYLP